MNRAEANRAEISTVEDGDPRTRARGGTRVLLVLRADGVGGAERTMASLIAVLDREGIAWDLVTLRPPRFGPGPLATHHPTVLDFPAPLPLLLRWKQLRWLRAVLHERNYRAVVSFGPVANGLVSLARRRGDATTVIVSERGDPYAKKRRSWNRWFLWTYRRADLAVVPTRGLADEARDDRRWPRRIDVIGNALAPQVSFTPREGPRERVIATVGRLAPVKRFQDVIEAFALLGDRADGWSLWLVGDGEERERLEALVRAHSLQERVRFLGVHPSPWELLARADVFVSCSAHEGFANAIAEAQASGCTVVSSDCRFGPRELIDDGVDGVLYPVGDVERLSQVLGDLIDQPQRREALARAAFDRSGAYSTDLVAQRWIELIEGGGARSARS